jgi:hypothetical protein
MQYASNAFTTNWGTRILREDSKLFKPTGYHYGSVWPLFTGWASLAEYRYDNDVQGFSHLMNNLNIYKDWALGFTEEVLNGAEYQPSGVCPHQCWSETMVLQPAIEGMLGFDADAANHRISLAPAIPAVWDSLSVSNIRCGDRNISFRMIRKDGRYHYSFSASEGEPVSIDFTPALPCGTKVTKATIDGNPLQIATFTNPKEVSAATNFSLQKNAELIFEYENGISVLPLISTPKPGDPSEGTRIIDHGLSRGSYSIELEGLSGTTSEIQVYLNDQQIKSISGGEIIKKEPGNHLLILKVLFENSGKKYSNKKIIIDIE